MLLCLMLTPNLNFFELKTPTRSIVISIMFQHVQQRSNEPHHRQCHDRVEDKEEVGVVEGFPTHRTHDVVVRKDDNQQGIGEHPCQDQMRSKVTVPLKLIVYQISLY